MGGLEEGRTGSSSSIIWGVTGIVAEEEETERNACLWIRRQPTLPPAVDGLE